MNNLADGWQLVPLSVLGEWGSGGTPSRSVKSYYESGTLPWLVIGDLNDGYVDSAATSITNEGLVNSAAKKLQPNTLLVAMYGSIGKLGITTFECATNQAIAFCRPSSEVVHLRYLFFALMNAKRALVKKGQGGAQQNISQGILKSHEIALAPIPEQKRIAEKLDAVLARVDACRERLDSVTALTARFRLSVLSAATSGRLTADWRTKRQASPSTDSPNRRAEFRTLKERLSVELKGKRRDEILELFSLIRESPDLPLGWVNCPVGIVGMVSNGSTPSRADQALWGAGVPWVSSGEVRNNLIYQTREQITDDGFSSCSVKLLPIDTVLIAMIGEGKTRGQSAVLKIPATINQNVAAVVPFEGLLHAEYLWYSFQAKYEANRREGNGTGPQALNCQRVRELELTLPPLPEQYEIVRRVEHLFALADRLEARLNSARSTASALTPALLAKAFRGELVPQDPSDEPVAELLKRLARERSGESTAATRIPRAKRTAPVAQNEDEPTSVD
ncbi:restriction endonuclease subunit S [Paraburkholderia antibiotica]|uniref:Type I restriction endonuclease subunit S n=1 Tax=Paraburkholderia antibiotica TaxID=2728839 RepID=A0A7X9ZXQ3_9BURK|nr:restriction endonuclease subunit S [Paraburkholderia antibiotica]NML30578.1 type I restriction endonuclease subunit S [Paraburkholderia antibiotica]